jgi:hypothetical protein
VRHHPALIASLVSAGLVVTGGGAALTAGSAAATAAPAAVVAGTGSWGTAQAIPGLTSGGEIDVKDVSCAPRGTCIGVGSGCSFTVCIGPFMVTDAGGAWGKPQPVPGLPLTTAIFPFPERIVCPAAGDCLITGEYGDSGTGFVLEEVNGKWGKPEAIPGLAGLDAGDVLAIDDAACAAPGYCTVTGEYSTGFSSDVPPPSSAFVVDEAGYRWRTAAEIPGLAALNVGGDAGSTVLSCPSPGNCTIVGDYAPAVQSPAARAARLRQLRAAGALVRPGLASPRDGSAAAAGGVFVDSEVNGSWQLASAAGIPGLAATGGAARTSNVACMSAGNCLAGGLYITSSAATTIGSFLLTQAGGAWSPTLDPSGMGIIGALACPGPGGCAAGGDDAKGVAAVMRQVGGQWGKPADLPGATALTFQGNKAVESYVDSLACPSAGNCTATGNYLTNPSPGYFPDNDFVAGEASGTWSAATVPAGLAALNTFGDAGDGLFINLSCAAVATCAVAGRYEENNVGDGGFVLAEIPLKATASAIHLSAARLTFGREQSGKIAVKVTATSGTPGGILRVLSGTRAICTITLRSGVGSCTLTARRLAKGTYHLVASYPATFGFAASSSRPATLTVVS